MKQKKRPAKQGVFLIFDFSFTRIGLDYFVSGTLPISFLICVSASMFFKL